LFEGDAENAGLENTGPYYMESVTTQKCSDSVERESDATAQKHWYQ